MNTHGLTVYSLVTTSGVAVLEPSHRTDGGDCYMADHRIYANNYQYLFANASYYVRFA